MATSTELINAIARAVNDADFSARSTAIFVQIFNDAHDEVIMLTECLRKIDSSITLTADTETFTIPSTFLKFPTRESEIKNGFVSIGTNGKFSLEIITMGRLNNEFVGWRGTTAGTPRYCYVIKDSTLKLGIYPKASTSFLSTNGTSVYLDHIYRPSTDLAYDDNTPFNGLVNIRWLQQLLKLKSIETILLEDNKFNKTNFFASKIESKIEEAKKYIQSLDPTYGNIGFGEDVSQW